MLVGNYLLIYLPGMATLFASNPFAAQPNPLEMMQVLQQAQGAAPSLGLLGILIMLVGILLQISIVRVTAATLDNQKINRHTIVSIGSARIFPLIGTHLVMGVLLVILFALLIIPGIIFSIYRTFASVLTILAGIW